MSPFLLGPKFFSSLKTVTQHFYQLLIFSSFVFQSLCFSHPLQKLSELSLAALKFLERFSFQNHSFFQTAYFSDTQLFGGLLKNYYLKFSGALKIGLFVFSAISKIYFPSHRAFPSLFVTLSTLNYSASTSSPFFNFSLMSDASTDPANSESSSPRAPQSNESTTAPEKVIKKKVATPLVLHPAQDKALKYASFMFSDTPKEQTAAEILQEAVSRHLGYMQKKGLEFPPGMLADLIKLKLIS
ncbi:MAG: hypothetical protein EOO61_05435 [Hymenobacter sp.]|nr:MAG: hypothetical protein EOO61_05435 [Hymenobacter sp.]